MTIELMDWQKEVAYGNQLSFLVPAGVRSGKNIAIVHALKERRTLVLETSYSTARQLSIEANHYGASGFYVDVMDEGFFKGYSKMFGNFAQFEQIIFNEPAVPRNKIKSEKVVDVIQETRKHFHGRIVVIGTPYENPDPVFVSLAYEANFPYVWEWIKADTYLTDEEKREFSRVYPEKRYRTEVLGEWLGSCWWRNRETGR